MMKKYWKRFVEWGTELTHDPFFWAKIKLTLLCSAIFISAIIFYLVLLNREFSEQTAIIAKTIPEPNRRARYIQRATTLSSTTLFSIQYEDVFMVFLTIGLSYGFASVALRPLKKILNSQKHFLADASHELRTPLAIIRTEMEVFLKDKQNWVESEKLLVRKRQSILSNLEEIDRMQYIIDNLLFLSRADSYAERFQFTKINLSTIISQILLRLDESVKRKQIDISLKSNGTVNVLGDPIKLEQAFLNIVKNAVKYTNKKGRIRVVVDRDAKYAYVSVTDTGIGIAQKDLSHVFERFFRSSDTSIKKTEGVGLGLTIAHMIIQKHKGRITVESEVGKGTKVTVYLPNNKMLNTIASNPLK